MSKIDDIEKAIDDLAKEAWRMGSIAGRSYAPEEKIDRLRERVMEKKLFLLSIIGARNDMYKITLPDDLFDME